MLLHVMMVLQWSGLWTLVEAHAWAGLQLCLSLR
jgi:hypothetical protein